MMAGRVWHVSLDLLDRQLRDRAGVECGKVDDLELSRDDDGALWVSAILAGPGVLAYRLGRRRLGAWVQRAYRLAGAAPTAGEDGQEDRTRIPIVLATNIAANIDLAVTGADLATHAGERWVGDHVIGHIPGHDHDTSDDDAADQ
jgi:hypothetical protein